MISTGIYGAARAVSSYVSSMKCKADDEAGKGFRMRFRTDENIGTGTSVQKSENADKRLKRGRNTDMFVSVALVVNIHVLYFAVRHRLDPSSHPYALTFITGLGLVWIILSYNLNSCLDNSQFVCDCSDSSSNIVKIFKFCASQSEIC